MTPTQSHKPVERAVISVVTAKFRGQPKVGGSFQNNWASHKMPMTSREMTRPARLTLEIETLSDPRNFLICFQTVRSQAEKTKTSSQIRRIPQRHRRLGQAARCGAGPGSKWKNIRSTSICVGKSASRIHGPR